MEFRLGGKIDNMEDRVKNLERKVDSNDDAMEDKIVSIVQRELKSAGHDPGPLQGLGDSSLFSHANSTPITATLRETRREEQFWEHRRCLRVWPVKGPDLQAAMATFLIDKLDFTTEDVLDVSPFTVSKHMDPRSKAHNEVVVHFSSPGVRDTVKAAAPKLGRYGRETGIRLHVPGFLLTNFMLLELSLIHI